VDISLSTYAYLIFRNTGGVSDPLSAIGHIGILPGSIERQHCALSRIGALDIASIHAVI
jgi:hypothetical protein